jgi:hypothetical protein
MDELCAKYGNFGDASRLKRPEVDLGAWNTAFARFCALQRHPVALYSPREPWNF